MILQTHTLFSMCPPITSYPMASMVSFCGAISVFQFECQDGLVDAITREVACQHGWPTLIVRQFPSIVPSVK